MRLLSHAKTFYNTENKYTSVQTRILHSAVKIDLDTRKLIKTQALKFVTICWSMWCSICWWASVSTLLISTTDPHHRDSWSGNSSPSCTQQSSSPAQRTSDQCSFVHQRWTEYMRTRAYPPRRFIFSKYWKGLERYEY